MALGAEYSRKKKQKKPTKQTKNHIYILYIYLHKKPNR